MANGDTPKVVDDEASVETPETKPPVPMTVLHPQDTATQAADTSAPAVTTGLPKPTGGAAPTEDNETDWDQVASGFMKDLQQRVQKQRQPDQQAAPRPGGFGAKLGGALADLVQSSGDADYGAYQERLRKAKAENQEMKLKEQREAREERESDQRMLLTNLQMGIHQRELKKLDIELQDASDTRSRAQVDRFEKAGLQVQRSIPQDELDRMIENYPKNSPDGKRQDFRTDYAIYSDGTTDINGKKVKTYSIVKMAGQPYQLSDSDKEFIKSNGGPDLSDTKEIPMTLYVSYAGAAKQVADLHDVAQKAGIEKMDLNQLQQLHTAMASREVGKAMTKYPEDPIRGITEALSGDPNNSRNPGINKMVEWAQAAFDKVKASPNANPDEVKKDQETLEELKSQQKNLQDYLMYGVKDPIVKEYLENHRKMMEDKQKAAYENKLEELKLMQIEAQTGTPEGLSNTGRNIAELDLGLDKLSKRAAMYNQQVAAADKYMMDTYHVHYDAQRADADFKYASKEGVRNTLNYLGSLTGEDNKSGNLGELIRVSDKIDRTEFPPLNDLIAWGKLKTGSKEIAEYQTAVTEVADQVAKILQGGGSGSGTSDAKLKQAQELFSKGFTKDQMRGIAGELRELLANRKSSMIGNNVYLRKWFGTADEKANPWNLKKGGTNAPPKETTQTVTDGAAQKSVVAGFTNDQVQGQKKIGNITIYKMKDGRVLNSMGQAVDPKTGQPLPTHNSTKPLLPPGLVKSVQQ